MTHVTTDLISKQARVHTRPSLQSASFEDANRPLPTLTKSISPPCTDAPVYAHTHLAALDRLLTVVNLARMGTLHDEVAALGVFPDWLQRHHTDTPYGIFICEHGNPLTSIFSLLGSFGAPQALHKQIVGMEQLRNDVRATLGVTPKTGILASPEHEVTTQGPAGTLHMVLPDISNDSFSRKSFLSKKEQKLLSGSAYRDLVISSERLEEFAKHGNKIAQLSLIEATKLNKRAEQQSKFNTDRKENGQPLTEEMLQRALDFSEQGTLHDQKARAALNFVEDWTSAMRNVGAESLSESLSTVSYLTFSSAFNQLLAQRFGRSVQFETVQSTSVNSILSNGISDWPTFITSFREAGIFSENAIIGRLRTEREGKVRYGKLFVSKIMDHDVELTDRDSHMRYSALALAEQSAESLKISGIPLLVPSAAIRYWANFAISNIIAFDDGMRYEPITTLSNAMRAGKLSLEPRALTLAPYTDLFNFQPAELTDPYASLKEMHTVLDYYDYSNKMHTSQDQVRAQ